jgi:hypothetical protein
MYSFFDETLGGIPFQHLGLKVDVGIVRIFHRRWLCWILISNIVGATQITSVLVDEVGTLRDLATHWEQMDSKVQTVAAALGTVCFRNAEFVFDFGTDCATVGSQRHLL